LKKTFSHTPKVTAVHRVGGIKFDTTKTSCKYCIHTGKCYPIRTALEACDRSMAVGTV